jgi:hypothetical protein
MDGKDDVINTLELHLVLPAARCCNLTPPGEILLEPYRTAIMPIVPTAADRVESERFAAASSSRYPGEARRC